MSNREQQIAALEKDWAENPRWKGIKRGYSAADVVRLRGNLPIEHTLARRNPASNGIEVGAQCDQVKAHGPGRLSGTHSTTSSK